MRMMVRVLGGLVVGVWGLAAVGGVGVAQDRGDGGGGD